MIGRRLFILLVLTALIGVLCYMYAWPAWRWHFQTKPALLDMLAATGGPPLETLRLSRPERFEYELVHEGIAVSSPYPITLNGSRLTTGSFSIIFSENFPDIAAPTYFAMTVGPLAVGKDEVNAAATKLERDLAVSAVENRALLFGGPVKFDRAAVVEGPESTVIMWSGSEIISGVVFDHKRVHRRDFLLKLDGVDREAAEWIVFNLRYVGE